MEQSPPPLEEAFVFWSGVTTKLAQRTFSLLSDAFQAPQQETASPLSAWVIGKSFSKAAHALAQNPAPLFETHQKLSADLYHLWSETLEQMNAGKKGPSLIDPEKNDKRFKDPFWENHPYFNFLKQSYLLSAKHLASLVEGIPDLDPQTAHKVSFYTRQFIDAASPSNFPLTNPKVVQKIFSTGGQNLLKGFENFMADLERGKGYLSISMTNPQDFELGVNLALTPGKVVFQNALLQLIQYAPSTELVARIPLLIVPPWINKYYIFDLRPHNSFVRWAVEQGHTVFIISWVNPDEKMAGKTFEDYMQEGLLEAMTAAQEITGEKQVNLIGYCLGGNLVSCLLAYFAQKGRRDVASATYLASLVNFSKAGDLTVFIDEEQLQALETRMVEKGYFDGRAMAATFSLLRANDLIWSFFIHNYLLGEDPFPLDFLYWNADSTRMPALMHSYYLRNMFQKNLLRQPAGLTLGGVPLDLRKIKTPTFILAARDDHIAPWPGCYEAVQLYKGPVEFVLAASGHVAGIINPPAAEKYSYFTAGLPEKKNALGWLKNAAEHKGSWWPYWQKWISASQQETVPARLLGSPAFPPLEAAPGSYVHVKT